jgi:hypothetical protein
LGGRHEEELQEVNRRAMKRVLRMALLASLVVLALSTCARGGDQGGTQAHGKGQNREDGTVHPGAVAQGDPTAAASAGDSLPEQGLIPAGEYATDEFEPDFSLEVGRGWEALAPEEFDALGFGIAPEVGLVAFTNPRTVFDPSNPSDQKEVPAPENSEAWVSWLQGHSGLDTSKPIPVRVGGASGVRMEVRVSSAPRDYPRGCPRPCVPLYPTSVSTIDAIVGTKDRLVIVDVGEETVVVDVGAPDAEFEELIPRAQEALATVKWE